MTKNDVKAEGLSKDEFVAIGAVVVIGALAWSKRQQIVDVATGWLAQHGFLTQAEVHVRLTPDGAGLDLPRVLIAVGLIIMAVVGAAIGVRHKVRRAGRDPRGGEGAS